jgi:phosphocarrier protein
VSADAGGTGEEPLSRTVIIRNQRGLHARAAAKFVLCAEMFDADIRVSRQGTEVSGRSIMGLMLLAAAPGMSIEVRASGREAADALAAIVALVENKFEED